MGANRLRVPVGQERPSGRRHSRAFCGASPRVAGGQRTRAWRPSMSHDERDVKPSEQRGGTAPGADEAREKGEWAATAQDGIVPAELGGSDASPQMLDDDPELGSRRAGRDDRLRRARHRHRGRHRRAASTPTPSPTAARPPAPAGDEPDLKDATAGPRAARPRVRRRLNFLRAGYVARPWSGPRASFAASGCASRLRWVPLWPSALAGCGGSAHSSTADGATSSSSPTSSSPFDEHDRDEHAAPPVAGDRGPAARRSAPRSASTPAPPPCSSPWPRCSTR